MSRGRKKAVFSLIFFGLLLAGFSAAAFISSLEEVTLADDAYHYRLFADGRHDRNYIEWWYFNFFDTRQDLQAIFTYFITDPENRSGHGLAQVVAVAYTSRGVVSEVDFYPPQEFSASYQQADVEIQGNAVQVIDPHTYRLVGASRNGRLSWDLTYLRQARPWFAADRMGVGRFGWELMSWLIYMPGAEVGGELVIDGQTYSIGAPGYHDHNWGEWNFSRALWNWAQYFEPELAFEMGDFIDQPAGVASLDFEGARTIFTKDQYKLDHVRWASDAENGARYPVQTLLRADNGTRRLKLRLEAIQTHPLRGDLPFPLPDVIVYEQTAHYEGKLWEKTSKGNWRLLLSFSGNGFKEYTARVSPRRTSLRPPAAGPPGGLRIRSGARRLPPVDPPGPLLLDSPPGYR